MPSLPVVTERALYLAAGSALDVGPVELVDAAGAAGFTGVGLRVSGEHRVGERQVARLRRRVDDLGIIVSEVEVIRIGDPTGDPRAVIDTAAALGAPSVLVVSDLADVSATRDALAGLAQHARSVGVDLGLEYMAWTTPSRPDLAVALALDCGVGVVCDVLHHHRVGATAGDVEAMVAAGVVAWVQICDAPFEAPEGGVAALLHEARHDRLPPGEGNLPVIDLIGVVPSTIPLSVEVQSDALRHSMDLATRVTLLHSAAQRWNTIGYRPK